MLASCKNNIQQRIWPKNLKGVLKMGYQVWNFVAFKPDDPIMTMPMAYSIVMCLNLGDWCILTLFIEEILHFFNFIGAKIR
jgi:hypothetical protein